MKTTLTLALIALTLTAKSQVSIIGGIHYSNLYGKSEKDKKAKFGFRGGVLIDAGHLQLTTLYASKGVMENRNQDPATRAFATDRWAFSLNVIQQSVSYNIGKGWFKANLGAYGSYLINSRLSNTFWPRQPWYASNMFKRFDYGPTAGISIDLHGAVLHGSYEYGLNTINDAGYVHEGFKNESVNLTVSVPL